MCNNFDAGTNSIIDEFVRIEKYPVDFSQAQFHARMLQNAPKYHLFSKALAAIVQGKTVLDIGTGSGILALLSYAHGAKKVVAVDRKPINKITANVLNEYGVNGLIEVIEGDIFDIDLANAEFDVIISETIGYLGYEENISHIMLHAQKKWANAHTVFLPSDITLWMEPLHLLAESTVNTPYLSLSAEKSQNFKKIQSPPVTKLGAHLHQEQTVVGVWQAVNSAEINAMAFYFDSNLGNSVRITNKNNVNWPHCIIPLNRTLNIRRDEIIKCSIKLKPSQEACYQVAICMNDYNGISLFETIFKTTEINKDRIPEGPNTVAVVSGVENILRSVDLFYKLSTNNH